MNLKAKDIHFLDVSEKETIFLVSTWLFYMNQNSFRFKGKLSLNKITKLSFSILSDTIRCLMNFVSKLDFFCLFWWEMFTTNMIVHPCEQNQNGSRNRLAPVNTGKFTFQKSDGFDSVTIRDLYKRSLMRISWVVV